jgi:hypothetical protein
MSKLDCEIKDTIVPDKLLARIKISLWHHRVVTSNTIENNGLIINNNDKITIQIPTKLRM